MDKEEARDTLKLTIERMHLFSSAVKASFPKNLVFYCRLMKLEKEIIKRGFRPRTTYPYGLRTIAKFYIDDQKEN